MKTKDKKCCTNSELGNMTQSRNEWRQAATVFVIITIMIMIVYGVTTIRFGKTRDLLHESIKLNHEVIESLSYYRDTLLACEAFIERNAEDLNLKPVYFIPKDSMLGEGSG